MYQYTAQQPERILVRLAIDGAGSAYEVVSLYSRVLYRGAGTIVSTLSRVVHGLLPPLLLSRSLLGLLHRP
jgi:hypothetical protein